MEVPADFTVLKYVYDNLPIELISKFKTFGHACHNPDCDEVVETG